MGVTASEVVDFWRDAGPDRWFGRDETFDDMCELGFEDVHEQAARGELAHWMDSADGALALVILLDQIPRNIYRDEPRKWASDELARQYAREAVERGYDEQIGPDLRMFFYMPFLHSEDMADQQRSLELFGALPGENADQWARHHHAIIERFGRFPHRNALLGRDSTPDEEAWLAEGGFKG